MPQTEPLNIEALCAAARRRVAAFINRSAAQHLRAMREGAQK